MAEKIAESVNQLSTKVNTNIYSLLHQYVIENNTTKRKVIEEALSLYFKYKKGEVLNGSNN